MHNEIDSTGCGDTAKRGPFIQTYSGRAFYLLDPRPDEVELIDVAHQLAMQNRYAGACRSPYSVAQHSVLVSRIVPPQYAIYGLMHDAAEAYCQDITRPMKLTHRALGYDQYGSIEAGVRWAIFERFGLDESLFQSIAGIIKHADNVAASTEKRDVLHPSQPGVNWGPMEAPLSRRITLLTWTTAKLRFLSRFNELLPEGRFVAPKPPTSGRPSYHHSKRELPAFAGTE